MELTRRRGVATIQDSQSCIPLSDQLKDGDIILLLTPGVVPEVSPLNRHPDNPPSDPFEPLGKALAKHHPWVRHVPYLPRNGITGTHVVHIRLAAAVVFVVSGPPCHGQPSQVALAEITRALCEHRPQIILTCCDLHELGPIEKSFPTIVEIPSFAPLDLEAAADVLFEPRKPSPRTPDVQHLNLSPKAWPIEVWDGNRDVSDILDLWCQCFPDAFHLDRYRFQSLLRRDGYAMHYVVREPGTSQILGFCATYTTYADSGGERLLGSLAALIVRPAYRQRGIGLSLHTHALRQLQKIRGVCRLQLGSTFPRLLYGLPLDSPCEDWFRHRGWPIKPLSSAPGSGQEVCDWFLKFRDWPATGLMLSHLAFRPCKFTEFDMVLDFVGKESRKKDHMGWYDQYAKLANTMNVGDIVVGLEGGAIIAVALTYVKKTGSPAAEDLPWASTIADDVGGVTCVCVSGMYPR
jgi:GNAT superfamily N-acetyltransferase